MTMIGTKRVVSGHLGIYSQVRKKCEPGNIIPRFDRSATWEYFNIPRFRVLHVSTNLGIFFYLDFLVILDKLLTKVKRGYAPPVLSFLYLN